MHTLTVQNFLRFFLLKESINLSKVANTFIMIVLQKISIYKNVSNEQFITFPKLKLESFLRDLKTVNES